MEVFNQNYFTCAETPENCSLHKSPPPYRHRRHQLKVFDQRPYGTKENGKRKKLKNIFFRGFLYSFKIGFLPFLPQFSTLIFKKNPIIRNLSTVYIREQFYTNSRVSSVCLLLILSIIPSKSF